MTTPGSPPPAASTTTVDSGGGAAIVNSQLNKSIVDSQIAGDVIIADQVSQTTVNQTEEIAYQVGGACPYLGLSIYDYDQREKYTGREDDVLAAIASMTEAGKWRSLYFVTGASGCGKSSFAQAGLLPALENAYKKQGFAEVRRAVFRPSSAPLAGLAGALQELGLPPTGPFAPAATLMLRPPTTNLPPSYVSLLVIDQFEELFTQSDHEQSATVLTILEQLPAFKECYLHVIATMRADYLPELFARRALYQVAKQGSDLWAMTEAELKQAIVRPLELLYPNREKRFEPVLLDRLAADAAADATYLPLLQTTLEQLWSGGRLRLSEYASLTTALEAHAEAVFTQAQPGQPRAPEEQQLIMQLLLKLVKVADDDDPRRDVRVRRARADLEQDLGDRAALIDELADARLLSTATVKAEADGSEIDVVDIIHGSLIHKWPRLQAAIAERRREKRRQTRFAQRVDAWIAGGESDANLLVGIDLEEALALQQANDIELRGGDARGQAARRLLARSLEQRAKEQRERFMPAIVQSLAAQALREQAAFFNDERAALLARQAYLFGQATSSPVQDRSDDALRTVLSKPFFSLAWERAPSAVLAFSPNGRWLAAGGYPGITLLDHGQPDVELRELFTTGDQDSPIEALAFSPDSRILAAGGYDNQVWLWKLDQLDIEPRILSTQTSADAAPVSNVDDASAANRVAVQALAFSPDGRLLASTGDDKTIRLWDVHASEAAPRVLTGHEASVEALVFSPDGQVLVSCGYDGTFRLWNLQKPDEAPAVVSGFDAPVQALAFSPDGNFLATGSNDNLVRIWDWHVPAAAPALLPGHRGPILALAFSPDGQTLASGGDDRFIRFWDLRPSGSDPIVLPGSQARACSVAVSADRQWLAAGGYNQEVGLWNLDHLDAPVVLSEHVGGIRAVAFTPDRKQLAAGDEQSLRLWDLQQSVPAIIGVFETGSAFEAAAFSPDGRLLAAGSRDNLVRVWKNEQPDEPIELSGHTGAIKAVVFSANSQSLASCAEDGTVRVWDLQALDAAPLVLEAAEVSSLTLAFSPDGRALAAACLERTVALWNLDQPAAQPYLLRGHEAEVCALAFSPDGRMLASGGLDATVRLWDVQKRESRAALAGHKGPISLLMFNDDGAMLMSCDESLCLHLWPAHTSAVADQVCARVNRNLTYEEWQRFVGQDIPYERTCAAHPVHPSVRQAAHNMALGNLNDAVGLLRRVAELDPTLNLNPEAEAHEAAAAGFADAGRLTDVLAQLDAARAADPRRDLLLQREILLRAGLMCASLGHADDAVNAFHTAQALKPDVEVPAEDWQQLCSNLVEAAYGMAVENFDGAVGLLRRVAELDPTRKLNPEAEVHQVAADALAESGRLADVIGHLQAARAADPQCDLGQQRDVLARTGVALADADQFADALKAFDTALALGPDLTIAAGDWQWLCWRGSLAGHADMVLAAGDRAVAQEPENGEFRDTRGLARALTGDFPGAIEDFNAFVKWAKGNEQAVERVALRKQFVAALRKGRNPFDEATIEQLRGE